jgi:hypothetical protein
MEIILYILRIVLLLCFIHFVLYYNNIDIFDIIQKQRDFSIHNNNKIQNDNVNIEDNIKELQHTLKELESI